MQVDSADHDRSAIDAPTSSRTDDHASCRLHYTLPVSTPLRVVRCICFVAYVTSAHRQLTSWTTHSYVCLHLISSLSAYSLLTAQEFPTLTSTRSRTPQSAHLFHPSFVYFITSWLRVVVATCHCLWRLFIQCTSRRSVAVTRCIKETFWFDWFDCYRIVKSRSFVFKTNSI